MFYTQEEGLTCGFWLMEDKGVYEFDNDILGMKQDHFSIWERGSLENSVIWNYLMLTWIYFLNFEKGWHP